METQESRIAAVFTPLYSRLPGRWRTAATLGKAILVVTFYLGTLLLLFVVTAEQIAGV